MPSLLLGVFIPIHLNVCSAACIWRSSRIIAAFATDVYSYRRNCQTTRKQTMKQFKYLFASVKVEAVNFLRVTGYSNNNLFRLSFAPIGVLHGISGTKLNELNAA